MVVKSPRTRMKAGTVRSGYSLIIPATISQAEDNRSLWVRYVAGCRSAGDRKVHLDADLHIELSDWDLGRGRRQRLGGEVEAPIHRRPAVGEIAHADDLAELDAGGVSHRLRPRSGVRNRERASLSLDGLGAGQPKRDAHVGRPTLLNHRVQRAADGVHVVPLELDL